MSLFQKYPVVVYPLLSKGKLTPFTVTDIMTRVAFNMLATEFLKTVDNVTLQPGDTPEAVSYRVYGTPNYHWTVLFANNAFDYIENWYKTDEQLEQYCKDKYGDAWEDGRYIVDDYGVVISSYDVNLTSFQANADIYTNIKYEGNTSVMTYFDYESRINERLRYIKVIKPAKIVDFINSFNAELAKAVN